MESDNWSLACETGKSFEEGNRESFPMPKYLLNITSIDEKASNKLHYLNKIQKPLFSKKWHLHFTFVKKVLSTITMVMNANITTVQTNFKISS